MEEYAICKPRKLRNAGAVWRDAPVVVDGKLATSRKPGDIPAFDQALLEELTPTGACGPDGA